MTTIAQIQKSMRAFDTYARSHADVADIQAKWTSLFDTHLDKKTATSFVQYYRKMKSHTRRSSKKQKGGMAPLNYTMTPGANVSVYGRFPVEVDTDPASIRDLDVYFHDALTKDCGNPAQDAAFPRPPSDMGSNQVGGRKSRRVNRRRNTLRKQKNRKTSRKVNRKTNRKHRNYRGGNLGTTLAMHPFLASAPPNYLQTVNNGWSGSPSPLPFPGAPTQHAWQYVSNGTAGTIDPGVVTPIGTDFSKLAGTDLYQTAQ